MIKTLQRKFILINMIIVFIVLACVFSIFTISNYNKSQDESYRSLHMILNRKDNIRPPIFEIGKKPPEDFTRSPIFLINIYNNDQIKLIYGDNINISQDILNIIGKKALDSESNTGVLKEYNIRFEKITEKNITKIAFIEISEEQLALKHSIILSTSLIIIAMIIFFFISLFLAKWALKPVENSWQQQKQFVSDASHELKTPLTVMLANMDILLINQDDTIRNQIKWIQNSKEEAIIMKQLLNNMLFLAKSDTSKILSIHSNINLSDLIINVSLSFESLAFEKKISIDTSNIQTNIFVLGDENQLKQLLSILIDNAIKYSETFQNINIELISYHAKAELKINNYGVSLSKSELEHVFDRFYRCDKSRSEEGYGLGLSIAKTIVKDHKGKIYAKSYNNKTTFGVILPLAILS